MAATDAAGVVIQMHAFAQILGRYYSSIDQVEYACPGCGFVQSVTGVLAAVAGATHDDVSRDVPIRCMNPSRGRRTRCGYSLSGVRDAAIRVITDHGEIPSFPLADKDAMAEVVDASKRHGRPIKVVISDLL